MESKEGEKQVTRHLSLLSVTEKKVKLFCYMLDFVVTIDICCFAVYIRTLNHNLALSLIPEYQLPNSIIHTLKIKATQLIYFFLKNQFGKRFAYGKYCLM